MEFKILISKRAQLEIENSIDFYLESSSVAPINFIEELEHCYNFISKNPYQRTVYKTVRLKSLKVTLLIYFML